MLQTPKNTIKIIYDSSIFICVSNKMLNKKGKIVVIIFTAI